MLDVCHPECDSETVYLQLSTLLDPISLLGYEPCLTVLRT